MNEQLSILIKAKLNSTQEEIQKQLDKLKGQLAVKLKIDASGLKVVSNQVEQETEKIQRKYKKVFAKPISINTELKGFNESEIKKHIQSIRQGVQEISKISIQTNAKGDAAKVITTYKDNMGKLVQETMQWTQHLDKANNTVKNIFKTTGFKMVDDFDKAKKNADNLAKSIDKAHAAALKMNEKFDADKLGSQVTTTDNTKSIEKQVSSIDKLIARYKAGQITFQEFDKYGRQIAESSNFRNKSLEQQARLLQSLESAERRHTASLTQTESINRRVSESAIRNTQSQITSAEKLALFQKEMNQRASALQGSSAGRFLNTRDGTNINEFLGQVNNLNSSTPNLQNRMANLRLEFQRINSTTQNLSRNSLNLGESIRQAAIKFPFVNGGVAA